MTKLDKEVVRFDATSNLVVKLTREGFMVKEKNRRKWFGPLPYGHLFMQAVRGEVHLPGPAKPRVQGRALSRGLLSVGR